MVPDAITAASEGPLLHYQYAPLAILKPKNRKQTVPADFRGFSSMSGGFLYEYQGK
jgi:hypothetical protein